MNIRNKKILYLYNKKNLYKLLNNNQSYYFNKKLEFWYLSSQNSDYKADSYNELTNHLDNVLSIESDRVLYKQGDDYDQYNKYNDSENQCSVLNDKISIYPDILDYNDYYPFGSTFEDASKTALAMDYRFGFNGMESDDEVKGDDNNYTTMFRQYDPRLGRLLSTDPLVNKYPSISPYSFVGNMPIVAIDPDSRLIILINGYWGYFGGINSPIEDYWGKDGKWVKKLKDHWSDDKTKFYDGSLGGQNQTIINYASPALYLFTDKNLKYKERYKAGKIKGYNEAHTIIEKLEAGETIKFVTNSMGAAFQRGFSDGLYNYKENDFIAKLQESLDITKDIYIIQFKIDIMSNNDFMRTSEISGRTLEELKNNLSELNTRLNKTNEYIKKLENIKTSIVVDIEPQNTTKKDKNAQNHYYILSDKSAYNWFERNFLDIQPVAGAKNASKKPDKTPVTKGHHSSFVTPTDLPKPQE